MFTKGIREVAVLCGTRDLGTKTETIYGAVTGRALKQPLGERSWLLATGSKGHFLQDRQTDRLRLALSV